METKDNLVIARFIIKKKEVYVEGFILFFLSINYFVQCIGRGVIAVVWLLVTGPVPDAKLPVNHNRKPLLKHEPAPENSENSVGGCFGLGFRLGYWVLGSPAFSFCTMADGGCNSRWQDTCNTRNRRWGGGGVGESGRYGVTDRQQHQNPQELRAGGHFLVTDTPHKI